MSHINLPKCRAQVASQSRYYETMNSWCDDNDNDNSDNNNDDAEQTTIQLSNNAPSLLPRGWPINNVSDRGTPLYTECMALRHDQLLQVHQAIKKACRESFNYFQVDSRDSYYKPLNERICFEIKESTIPGAGLGLFSLRSLPMTRPARSFRRASDRSIVDLGRLLMNYCGEFILSKNQAPTDSAYVTDFLTDDECGLTFDINAKNFGNSARYINDPQGTNKKVNCVFLLYYDKAVTHNTHTNYHQTRTDMYEESMDSFQIRVGVFQIADIQEGDELLLSYGEDYWNTIKKNKAAKKKRKKKSKACTRRRNARNQPPPSNVSDSDDGYHSSSSSSSAFLSPASPFSPPPTPSVHSVISEDIIEKEEKVMNDHQYKNDNHNDNDGDATNDGGEAGDETDDEYENDQEEIFEQNKRMRFLSDSSNNSLQEESKSQSSMDNKQNEDKMEIEMKDDNYYENNHRKNNNNHSRRYSLLDDPVMIQEAINFDMWLSSSSSANYSFDHYFSSFNSSSSSSPLSMNDNQENQMKETEEKISRNAKEETNDRHSSNNASISSSSSLSISDTTEVNPSDDDEPEFIEEIIEINDDDDDDDDCMIIGYKEGSS